jgi:ATPase subunit of ABC transporter with duplicated ATPase domains
MKTASDPRLPKIGVVGPCTSGKTTLIRNLRDIDQITLRHIAQEHSYVPTMWQKITNPDWLIFLDVSFPVSMKRKRLNWNQDEYQEQQRRLAHARANADFYLMTDSLTAEEVAAAVKEFLNGVGVLSLK